MKDNLISQFQGKKVLSAILESLAEELEEISKVAEDLKNKRWIDTAKGVTLDGLGDIVGQPREIIDGLPVSFFGFMGQPSALGFGQGRFRDSGDQRDAPPHWCATNAVEVLNLLSPLSASAVCLLFKSKSQGTIEDTIQSLKYIFKADKVIVEDVGNAKIRIGIGRELTAKELILAQSYNLMIKAGGVGIESAVQFDGRAYFGFLGQNGIKGFEKGKFADGIELNDGTPIYYFGFLGQKKIKGFEEGRFA